MLQKRANLFSPLKLFFNTYSFFSANLIWAEKKNHPNPPKIQGEQSIIIFLPLSRYQVLQNVVYEIKFFVVAMFLFLRQMSLKWVKFKKWHLVEGLWSQVFLKSAQQFLRYGHFKILALKWGQNWGDEKKISILIKMSCPFICQNCHLKVFLLISAKYRVCHDIYISWKRPNIKCKCCQTDFQFW